MNPTQHQSDGRGRAGRSIAAAAARALITALAFLGAAASVNAKDAYIPVAGVTPGGNGTFFRSDVRIFNPSPTETIGVTLHFLPQEMDGRNIPGRMVTIPPRQVATLNDVVGFLAPELQAVIGAIRLDSNDAVSHPFVASSRIYTNTPRAGLPGTYGQFVPAMELEEASEESVILHVASTEEFRTNAGVMNPNNEPVVISAEVRGFDGVRLLESPEFVIPPKSMRQFAMLTLFGGFFMTDGYIVIRSSRPVFTYGSVIDNFSGDQIFVPGRPD